jgi:flavorubredoxin
MRFTPLYGAMTFSRVLPIPYGVSLNSYLIKGEKTALIDMVRDWVGAPIEIKNQLDSIVSTLWIRLPHTQSP